MPGRRRNDDATEAQILLRALREQWEFPAVRRALRDALSDLDPFPDPPSPTNEAPGTREKILILAARCGRFKLHHADDRQHDSDFAAGNTFTQNRNGRGTELEEQRLQGRDAWFDPDEEDPRADYRALDEWHDQYAAALKKRRAET